MKDTLAPAVDGVATAVLHKDTRETVTYHQLDAAASLISTVEGGIEVLVIEGSISESDETLGQNAWLRLPDGQPLRVVAGFEGAKLWVKSGHLPFARAPEV